MAAGRKLQAEIEKLLKKVDEGIEEFHHVWDSVHGATNANQREKFESELKTQIKKLQRDREQIKTWLSDKSVKDKNALTESRKKIEAEMERFKEFERDLKTKTYSKEGLSKSDKVDPHEEERARHRQWIQEGIDKLNVQIDEMDADLEAQVPGGKKSKKKEDRGGEESAAILHLKHMQETHRWHVTKLEQLLRKLENDDVDLPEVGNLKDNVEYYVDDNSRTEGEFQDFMEIYEGLALENIEDYLAKDRDKSDGKDEECDLSSLGDSKPDSSAGGDLHSRESAKKEEPKAPSKHTAGPAAQKPPNSPALSASRRATREESGDLEKHDKKPSTWPPIASVWSTPAAPPEKEKAPPPPQPPSQSAAPKPGPPSTRPAPSMPPPSQPAPDRPPPPGQAPVLNAPPSQPPPKAAPAPQQPPSAPPKPAPPQQPPAPPPASTPPPASAPPPAPPLGSPPRPVGPPTMVGTLPMPAPPSMPPPAPDAGGAGEPPLSAPPPPPPVLPPPPPAPLPSAVQRPPAPAVKKPPAAEREPPQWLPPPAPLEEEAAPPRAAPPLEAPPPPTESPPPPPASAMPRTASEPNDEERGPAELGAPPPPPPPPSVGLGGAVAQAAARASSPADAAGAACSASAPGAAAAAAASSAGMAVASTGLGVIGGGLGREKERVLSSLNGSFRNLPCAADSRRKRKYTPRNPYTHFDSHGHAAYPMMPTRNYEHPDMFEKYEHDTLFFIFYYQQGSYQQHLAAKELKKLSWRYHTKYLTWFQRHEEPREAGSSFERGAYVYFDHDSGWCQRIKADFAFEYQYLEEDPAATEQ